MNVKELRIGNYVNGIVTEEEIEEEFICEIDALDSIQMSDYSIWLHDINGGDNDYYEDIKSISLTEEWLVDFGFKNDGIGHFYLNPDDDYYGFVDREDLGFMLVVHGEEHKETYVKNVHQLQNLYFALTGKELELKK